MGKLTSTEVFIQNIELGSQDDLKYFMLKYTYSTKYATL